LDATDAFFAMSKQMAAITADLELSAVLKEITIAF